MPSFKTLKEIIEAGAVAGLSALESPEAEASFYGTGAKMADEFMFMVAQKMKKEGHSVDDIFEKTRWFEDQGKWKFEVDDSNANWKTADLPVYTKPMSEVWEDDNLKFNYPEIYDKYKFASKTLPENVRGEHYKDSKKINLNRKRNLDEQRSTMLHENQHAIQDAEGWQSGSNPERFDPTLGQQAYDEAIGIKERLDRLGEQLTLLGQRYNETSEPKYLERYTRQREKFKELAEEYDKRKTDYETLRPHSVYEAVQGEVEARNVQTRDLARRTANYNDVGKRVKTKLPHPHETASRKQDEIYAQESDAPTYISGSGGAVGKSQAPVDYGYKAYGAGGKGTEVLDYAADKLLNGPVQGLAGIAGLLGSGQAESRRLLEQDPWDTGTEVGEAVRGQSNSPMVNAAAEAAKWFTRLF